MKHRPHLGTPSPALVVATIALIVSLSGTAIAARTLITSPSQIKNGVVTSSHIRNSTITNADVRARSLNGSRLQNNTITLSKLRDTTQRALVRRAAASVTGSSTGGPGAKAIEAYRKAGPDRDSGGRETLATLRSLAPGSYLILAATTITTPADPRGLGELFRSDRVAAAECTLDAGGDSTKGQTNYAFHGQAGAASVSMQITRTLGRPADVVLSCQGNYPWRAGDTSIVAVPLGDAERREVGG
jgi:hypothetical protein